MRKIILFQVHDTYLATLEKWPGKFLSYHTQFCSNNDVWDKHLKMAKNWENIKVSFLVSVHPKWDKPVWFALRLLSLVQGPTPTDHIRPHPTTYLQKYYSLQRCKTVLKVAF